MTMIETVEPLLSDELPEPGRPFVSPLRHSCEQSEPVCSCVIIL